MLTWGNSLFTLSSIFIIIDFIYMVKSHGKTTPWLLKRDAIRKPQGYYLFCFYCFWYYFDELKKKITLGFFVICCCISYRIQSFALQSKISGWFLYEMQHQAELGYAKIPPTL